MQNLISDLYNGFAEFYYLAPTSFRFAYYAWSTFFLLYYFANLYDNNNGKKDRIIKEKNFNLWFPFILFIAFLVNHIGLKWDFQWNLTQNSVSIKYMNLGGLISISCGLIIVVRARAILNGYWGPDIYDYLHPRVLITQKIYSRIRHPIYTGQIIMAFATALLSNNAWIWIFPIVLGVINAIRARNEDMNLKEEFGSDFMEYRKKVYGWIPGLY